MNRTIYKGMKRLKTKWCQKLRTFLFEGTFAFQKMWQCRVFSCSFGSDAGVEGPSALIVLHWVYEMSPVSWREKGKNDRMLFLWPFLNSRRAGLQRWRHVLHWVGCRRRPCNWQWRENRKTGKYSHATIIFKIFHHPQLFNPRWMPNSSQKVLAVSWEQAHQNDSNDTPQQCQGY